MEKELFKEWCVLELMGHRKLAGMVSEQAIGGASFIRIDVPGENGMVATQFYSPASIYCITPVKEEIARGLAKSYQPEPVSKWELPAPIKEANLIDPLADPYAKDKEFCGIDDGDEDD